MAGGSGTRAGGDIPKQFQLLAGRPIILYSIDAFVREDAATRLVIVVHRQWEEELRRMILNDKDLSDIEYIITTGGASRPESVSRGLEMLTDMPEDTFVAVHDAARPMIDSELIARGWGCVADADGAVPVVPLTDSIRRHLKEGGSETLNRADFCLVQTPQVFPLSLLREAYGSVDLSDSSLTDDASVVERFGKKVKLYQGDPANMKVTNPIDFTIAEALMANG